MSSFTLFTKIISILLGAIVIAALRLAARIVLRRCQIHLILLSPTRLDNALLLSHNLLIGHDLALASYRAAKLGIVG